MAQKVQVLLVDEFIERDRPVHDVGLTAPPSLTGGTPHEEPAQCGAMAAGVGLEKRWQAATKGRGASYTRNEAQPDSRESIMFLGPFLKSV
jgi:hypothetical protein